MAQGKAALYIRVSTDAQFEEGYSADAQREMLEAYCVAKQIQSSECYVDGGFSGSNIERPEMQRLIEDAKAGRIQVVIVYKLDRLSRSQKDTLYLIEDVFLPHNVDFVSLNENLDTGTPYGRAMIGILSAFAQLERETIRERTRMGMRERVKSGLWMGGGRIPFGYDYDKEQGILVPNKDAETVRRIYDLYLKGYSCSRIAQMVGLKYERLALQILTRKSNTGVICYNGEEYPGQHEPIIPQETYEQAMAMMRERSNHRLTTSKHLLSGLVYCGKCGAKMRYQQWGKHDCKLWCYSQDKHKTHLIRDPDCDNEKVWASEVEDAVLRNLFQMALQLKEQPAVAQTPSAEELLRGRYDAEAAKLKRLYGLYASAEDDLLRETIEEQKGRVRKLQEQLQEERERGTHSRRQAALARHIENLSQVWDILTFQQRQHILRQLVDRIVLTDGDIQIYYQFETAS
jgi:site-specific DNA recombinase